MFDLLKVFLLATVFSVCCLAAGTSKDKKKVEKQEEKFTKLFSKHFNEQKQNTISKTEVQRILLSDYSKTACSPQTKLIKCHSIKKESCKKMINENLKVCFKKIGSKKRLSSSESLSYSREVGKCMGKENKLKLSPLKRKCHG